MDMLEIVWPRLKPADDVQAATDAAQKNLDLDRIAAARPTKDIDVLIEEARRLGDAETERGKSAETKATTYLAVVGVLAPLLATLAPTALSAVVGPMRAGVTLVLFVLAGAYLLGCAHWAFKTMRVSVSARLDAVNLLDVWAEASPKPALARGLLKCVRLNRDMTNEKVSCIKMAHAFGLRAFVVFVSTVIILSAWVPTLGLGKAMLGVSEVPTVTSAAPRANATNSTLPTEALDSRSKSDRLDGSE